MDLQVADKLKQRLNGQICKAVTVVSGLLQLDTTDCNLSISSAWRIKCGDRLFGSGMREVEGAEWFHPLVGQRIILVDIIGEFHDLRLMFEDGSYIETIADTDEYESWTFGCEGKVMIISGPGTSWANF
ncbi:MAG: hypothetical protein GY788_00245 [bacterium]|nr:hypothetical protein [bacterium]